MKYKVWSCKVVVPENFEVRWGCDSPPREAVKKAIADMGLELIMCFSGWNAKLTDSELECTNRAVSNGTAYNSKR